MAKNEALACLGVSGNRVTCEVYIYREKVSLVS